MTSNRASGSPARSLPRADWSHSDTIKRESRHIFNKLHSISLDSSFVNDVHTLYPSLLLTANLRCGAWYTPPSITSAVSYFKSTDGHTHQWSFSLKRSNLHLVEPIVQAGGAVVVDSTRRGKSMPDALSKTIPIWCAVLNSASQKQHGTPKEECQGYELETPKWMIPPTEHDQIQERITTFVKALLESDLEVPKLQKPLKPVFVTPQMDLGSLPKRFEGEEYTPVVLVSASKFVADSAKLNANGEAGPSEADRGFVYVQGAGDDHENWARGLTPDVYWRHQTEILACSKDDVEALVDKLVFEEAAKGGSGGHWFTPLAVGAAPNVLANSDKGDVAVGQTGVYIGVRAARHIFTDDERQRYDLIIHFTSCSPPPLSSDPSETLASLALEPSSSPRAKVHSVHLSPNKKGLNAMRTAFPPAISLAHSTLTSSSPPPDPADKTEKRVLVCCQDGKDLSGSLVVAILASSFSDSRLCIEDPSTRSSHLEQITKDTTKRRLQWLVSAHPRAAPSRAFLLRVNELLISHHHRPIAPLSSEPSLT